MRGGLAIQAFRLQYPSCFLDSVDGFSVYFCYVFLFVCESIGELLVWGTLKGEIPAERQAKAEEIIAMLHSHALVKGYSGGNAVPLHAASHLRFLVGGDETVAMVE